MPTLPKLAATVKRFAAWSYSKLVDYEQCPLFARLKHLDKRGDRKSDAMERGADVHEAAQVHVVTKKKAVKLPKVLQYFKKEFAWLRTKRRIVQVEQQWALDSKWQPTAWFESDAQKAGQPLPWLRVVLDAVVPEPDLVTVIDYKTGKVRDSNKRQLELYALAGFAKFPKAPAVAAKLWYLDQGVEEVEVFQRDAAAGLQKKWTKLALPMLRDTTFRPRPGRYCSWCPFRKSNGGPCQY